MNRRILIVSALLLSLGFGGGFVTAKATGGRLAGGGGGSAEQAGFQWPLFGKLRGENARRAGPQKPEGFAFWRQRVDTSGPDPQACLEMTKALDPSKPYADYVLVSPAPDGQPAVRVAGKGNTELCVGGLGFTDRRITLLKGLPGAGGETLKANADVDFTFGEKPPYVGFVGDGVILPREDADGVGIETINVSLLQVEVWRVPDRNLVRRQIAVDDPTPEGEYPDDWSDTTPDEEGQRVWKGVLAVQGQSGQRVTTVFPLGAVLSEMKPGGYVIKARDVTGRAPGDEVVNPAKPRKKPRKDDPDTFVDAEEDEADPNEGQPAQARRWVIFTDMALTAYQGSDGADVVVRSLKSAKPVSGVRVAVVARNGEDVAQATSDASGRVRFGKAVFAGKGAASPKMLMAYGKLGDLALLDLDRPPVDLSNQGIGGRMDPEAGDAALGGRTLATPLDGYLYADRGIYRPGETVHIVGLLRDQQARSVQDRKVKLVVTRPSGVEYLSRIYAELPTGAANLDLILPKTAPRGRWRATLKAEGVVQPVGELSFTVEDFAPQRLAVNAVGNEAVPVRAGETRPVAVLAKFLYGAAGAGLQVQGEARLRADPDPFPQFRDYRWGDEQQPFEEKFIDLGSTVTDGEGRAQVIVDPAQAAEAQGPLLAAVTASVFEPGGRPVRESLKLKVRPRNTYLGVKVEEQGSDGRDPTELIDIIAVDASGRRIASTVRWTLVAENWDYDWFQQDGRWQWRRTSRDAVVAQGAVNVGAGAPARLNRRLQWGDYRLQLVAQDGSRTVARFSAGWGAPAKEAEAPDFVRVSAGTKAYEQGDTIEVTIKAPYAGEAQVAVATDRIIDFKTFSVPEKGVTLKMRTSEFWGGGAYVLVSVVQPRDPADSPKPKRAIGLVYVPLEPKGRKLTVDVGTPDRVVGKTQLEVPVQVKGLGIGQRARVTVAAVDEGILQLTKFESPDPAKWYFGKKALTLNYRDDYGRLLDANLGAPANIRFGADEIGGEGLTVTPIRTVALWSGVVETGFDGKAVVKLPAPDFNGQLRIMAVAWTDGAVGSGSKELIVREPVVTELNLPRFLAPGDRSFATLEMHNLEGRPGAYTAEVSSSGGVMAALRKVFNLVLGQRLIERVPLAAPIAAGISKVVYKITGPGGFATGREVPIQTRLGWGPETRTFIAQQGAGEAFTPTSDMMAGLAAGSVSLQVSYSPFRGFDPAPIAVSMIRYPYGCTEQLVSSAYPLLYAEELAGDKGKPVSAGLAQAVGKLLDRQTLDGAFGLWRVGDGEADPWLGAYATDFLIEAKRRGTPVPQDSIDRALKAMKQVSRPEGWASVSYRLEYPGWWTSNEDDSKKATQRMRSRASAYALYVLARGGQGDLARLRWYHDVQMKVEGSPLAKAQVGAGLAMMGDRARARSAFRQASAALGYRDPHDWYQTPLRDLAGVIALAHEAGETDVAKRLQARLDGAVKDPDSLNTQEQARLLQAAHFMLKAAGPMRIEATGAMSLASAGGTPRWSVGKLSDARFVNRSGALWRTVTVRGTPVSAPAAQSQGLSVTKRLFTMQGAGANLAALNQGDRVIILIEGASIQDRTTPLVIDDPLPAGFEVETVLSNDDAKAGPFKFLGELTGVDVQEARDDRYVAATDLGGKERFAVAYVARAVAPGDYLLPAVEVRDMYRPAVFARTAPGRTVIAAGP
jgi:alpha-2-macroglobulin